MYKDPTTRNVGITLRCFNGDKLIKYQFLLSIPLASKTMGQRAHRKPVESYFHSLWRIWEGLRDTSTGDETVALLDLPHILAHSWVRAQWGLEPESQPEFSFYMKTNNRWDRDWGKEEIRDRSLSRMLWELKGKVELRERTLFVSKILLLKIAISVDLVGAPVFKSKVVEEDD